MMKLLNHKTVLVATGLVVGYYVGKNYGFKLEFQKTTTGSVQ